MAKLVEYKDMAPRAKAVVDTIARGRSIKPDEINNVWKALAVHPDVMERFAEELKAAMGPARTAASSASSSTSARATRGWWRSASRRTASNRPGTFSASCRICRPAANSCCSTALGTTVPASSR